MLLTLYAAMTDAKLEQWKTFFNFHDKDGSGSIQAHEFKGIHDALVKNNIPVPANVLDCFYAIDKVGHMR